MHIMCHHKLSPHTLSYKLLAAITNCFAKHGGNAPPGSVCRVVKPCSVHSRASVCTLISSPATRGGPATVITASADPRLIGPRHVGEMILRLWCGVLYCRVRRLQVAQTLWLFAVHLLYIHTVLHYGPAMVQRLLLCCMLCCMLVLTCNRGVLAVVVGNAATTLTDQTLQQQQQQTAPTCTGLGRREVDWWIMLKHPAGYQYSYLDSSFAGGCAQGSCWRHRLTMLNPNPVRHTLALLGQAASANSRHARISSDPRDPAYVIYNDDDPPGTEHFDFAHAKGVVAFSRTSNSSSGFQGFWLVHSAPRFPKDPAQPDFAELARAQSVFGQHFSCFSLSGKQPIAAVAEMLLTAGPYMYNSSLPDHLAADFPAWQMLINGNSHAIPMSVSISIQTAAGVPVHGFAKTKYLNASLTDAVVGPGLGSAMLWETWRRSHDALPSYCPGGNAVGLAEPFSSLNIQRIAFPNTPYTWASLTDHSKWGISSSYGWLGVAPASSSSSFNVQQAAAACTVCLGDMNRAWWQSQRGGGYVCAQHIGLWQAFNSIVAAVEPCINTVAA